MPRGQYKRVSSHNVDQDTAQLEETQPLRMEIGAIEIRPALSPAIARILILADRVATKYLLGKHGLALENDARAIKEALDSLPDDVRVLL